MKPSPAKLLPHLGSFSLLEERESKYHRIELHESRLLGKVLLIDGEIQHVEAWAPLYHEPLVHLPASFLREIREVLILGGGSFFAAAEVLKYESVKRVVMIDHDRGVTDLVATHYPHATAALRDQRLHLRHADAYKELARHRGRYDLVVNDALDLLTARGKPLFGLLASSLTSEGICTDLIYRHIFEAVHLQRTLFALRKAFRTAGALVMVPEYPGVLHLLTLWGYSASLSQSRKDTVNIEQELWVRNPASCPCVYFDPRFLSYYLYLPRYIRGFFQAAT